MGKNRKGAWGEKVESRNNGDGHIHVYSMTRIFSVSNFKAKTFLLLLHSRRSLITVLLSQLISFLEIFCLLFRSFREFDKQNNIFFYFTENFSV